jgi:CheY-like chemotaxis protein/anti-sigma regulatory factor (Ser/Thr protein kinase)
MTAKILIVDDEPFNLEIISEYFAESGYELVLCEAGDTAWSKLNAPDAHFDLIILDRMMPGLDGISLLKRIKADPRLAPLPVIMQTAASSPEQLREGLQAGAYYYLTKPYEQDSLLTIARAALCDAATKADLQQRLKEHGDALQLIQEATFELRTVEEASRLAAFLAQISPHPDCTILGLSELLINAVEHGNLGITYAEKTELKRLDSWHEEVLRRSALPENREKRVRVELCRNADGLTIRISDQGPGFDWEKYLDFDPDRAFDPNGRGIALARLTSFDSLTYEGRGNIVVASILDNKTAEQTP